MRAPALPSLAAALGHSPRTRLVILQQCDVGISAGANAAFLELSRCGGITGGAAMVPCPWFPQIATAARERELDLGIRLTLTSECPDYRWGPVSPEGHALADRHGYLPRTVQELRDRLDCVAAEAELRAQIDRAVAMGVRPTHLDTHLDVCLIPELRDLYVRLGADYRLPVILPRAYEDRAGALPQGLRPLRDDAAYAALLHHVGQPQIDQVRKLSDYPDIAIANSYRSLIVSLIPGVTLVPLCCSTQADSEMTAFPGAAARTDGYRLLRSALAQRWLAEASIIPIGMRVVKNFLYP